MTLLLFVGGICKRNNFDMNDIALDQQLELEIELRRHIVVSETERDGKVVINSVVLHANSGVYCGGKRQEAHLVDNTDRRSAALDSRLRERRSLRCQGQRKCSIMRRHNRRRVSLDKICDEVVAVNMGDQSVHAGRCEDHRR